jgi:nucleoside phosphorylase
MIEEKIDIVVFCATELEFKEVDRALTDSIESMHKERIKDREYEIQKISGHSNHTGITIALTSPKEIGRVPAAIAARDILYHFAEKPDFVILCGIAAADPSSSYQLGDVVVPQLVVDYAEQKQSRGGRILRAQEFSTSPRLHSAARTFSETNWFDAVPSTVVRFTKETNKVRTPAECHLDVGMACGDYVLDDEELVKDILSRLSRDKKYPVTSVEMESSAVARAIEMKDGDTPEFLVIKAISDFAYGKDDSAQPYARATAAYFLKGLLLELAKKSLPNLTQYQHGGQQRKPFVSLSPSANVEEMLKSFPKEKAAQWRPRAIDGAIEIFRCPTAQSPYGGFTAEQVSCEVIDNLQEWPDTYGGLTQDQINALKIGLLGDNKLGISGWLKEKGGKPGRIRVLAAPPTPPVLDRPSLHLEFGNSDYFTVRTITELARVDRHHGTDILKRTFPKRWSEPQKHFHTDCIPYHVSVQAVIVCRTPNGNSHLVLASTNSSNPSITKGWGATMAEQMWAPDRMRHGEPWWTEPARPFTGLVKEAQTREGDLHISDALTRGLREEFRIDVTRDLIRPPLLLCAAIEEDMYFVTFIYYVIVNASPEQIFEMWDGAPDRDEMGLLAAYPLTGESEDGTYLDGPRQLASLLAQDSFDPGPFLLPHSRPQGELSGPWHVSSKLRMYALGMHLWPNDFSSLVKRQ